MGCTLSEDNGTIGQKNSEITFEANPVYIFDQSDSTNADEQIVFGTTFDDKVNILGTADGVTVNGTPGTAGAYTQLVLDGGFSGTCTIIVQIRIIWGMIHLTIINILFIFNPNI